MLAFGTLVRFRSNQFSDTNMETYAVMKVELKFFVIAEDTRAIFPILGFLFQLIDVYSIKDFLKCLHIRRKIVRVS